MRHLLMAVLTVFVMSAAAFAGEKVELSKLPKPVADAVAKRFPKAEAKSASKGGADGKVVYEVTLKEGGKNIDVSLTDAGAITQIEKELAFADLPKEVAATFEKKYPKATYTIIEAVITVKDGKETLEYYEAVLVTADKKMFDAEVLPDGKFKGETEKTPKKEEKPNPCGDEKKGEKNEKGQKGEQSGFQGKQKGQNEDKDDKDDKDEGKKGKKKGKKKGDK